VWVDSLIDHPATVDTVVVNAIAIHANSTIVLVSPTDAPYWVIATDYTSYSVVYSCSSIGFFNTSKFHVLWHTLSPILVLVRYPRRTTLSVPLCNSQHITGHLIPIISEIVWILTRQQNPDSSTINTALGVLDLNSLSRTPLKVTSQSNCWGREGKWSTFIRQLLSIAIV
jgi:hypothetical protein